MTRPPYVDPVDLVWIRAAARCGLRVVTSREVYASWDGAGELSIAHPDDRDPDDCVAQLVLHEMCHALVEGRAAWSERDWGLCNHDDRDLVREHAAHRVQAWLTAPHGLRVLLAPTTEHRVYYDALPEDPLAACDDPALEPARAGCRLAEDGPWTAPLTDALAATAAIARAAAPFADGATLWSSVRADSGRPADAAGSPDRRGPGRPSPRVAPGPR